MKQLFEVRDVIVPPDHFLAAGAADALNHRIMIEASVRITQSASAMR